MKSLFKIIEGIRNSFKDDSNLVTLDSQEIIPSMVRDTLMQV